MHFINFEITGNRINPSSGPKLDLVFLADRFTAAILEPAPV